MPAPPPLPKSVSPPTKGLWESIQTCYPTYAPRSRRLAHVGCAGRTAFACMKTGAVLEEIASGKTRSGDDPWLS